MTQVVEGSNPSGSFDDVAKWLGAGLQPRSRRFDSDHRLVTATRTKNQEPKTKNQKPRTKNSTGNSSIHIDSFQDCILKQNSRPRTLQVLLRESRTTLAISKSDARFIDDTRRAAKDIKARLKRTKKLPADVRSRVTALLNELLALLKDGDIGDVRSTREKLERLVDREMRPYEKSAWREYAESIGIAVCLALVLRAFVIEAFKIPSSSMMPTLLVGDHLFVNKFVYGIRIPFTQNYVVTFDEPKKGEVVVFAFPRIDAKAHLAMQPAPMRACIDPSEDKDMIKRIMGVAGDTVELKSGKVFINGNPLQREFLRKAPTGNYLHPYESVENEMSDGKTYTIRLLNSGRRDFGPIKVKPGHVFVMGDNRDESADSRCWGQVPVENIKGRAMVLWWSKGPKGIRWERFGDVIK